MCDTGTALVEVCVIILFTLIVI